jgi:hypothetical protein
MRQCIASSLSNNFLPAGNVMTGRLVKKSLFAQNSLHALYTLVLSHKTCELEIQVFERPLAMTNCTLLPSQLQGILQASVQAAEDPCVSAQQGPGIPHAMLHLPIYCKNSFTLLSYVL